MTITPWGDSRELRDQKLAPGPGGAPGGAAESQRRRLLGAMVASVAEIGYENTGIAGLSQLAGVSPRSFYQHFEGKRECFLAALEAVISLATERVLRGSGASDWKDEARNRIVAFASFAAEQPAAARLLLVESYAAGAGEPVETAILSFERSIQKRLSDAGLPDSVPRELVVAAVAATVAGVRARLLSGQVRRLPEYADQLATFLLEFESPLRPLRAAARPPERRDEEREAGDHAERAIRAFEALLTETRLTAITMEQVAQRARMSRRTLYANFGGREELMLAAVDAAAMQVVATTLPAYRRYANAPEGVPAAFSALFGMLASRPNLAHLLLAGVHEGGAPALERLTKGLRQLDPVLAAGIPAHHRPVSIPVASEALLNAILGLAARRMTESGAGSLSGLVPIATYMVLATVLGAGPATAAAEGKSYRKLPPTAAQALLRILPSISGRILAAVTSTPMTAADLEAVTELPRAEIDSQIQAMEENGVVEALDPVNDTEPTRYRAVWGHMDTEQAHRHSRVEREALSMQVRQVIDAEIDEAVEAGTFDAREDRFLVRVPMWLDEQGWAELGDHLDRSLEVSLGIQERATARLRAAGDARAGSFGRLLLISFEVPRHEDEGAP